jgi:acetoin utilization protein AcuC
MAGPRAFFVGHEIYRRPAYGTLHPLSIPRVESVADLCAALGWLCQDEFRASPLASEEQLAAFHDRGYIAALREASATGRVEAAHRARYAIGTMENPVFPGMYERAATSVGGSMLAARLALEGHVAYHPAGGTHHGRSARASGFCFFNDPVFALRTLVDGGIERVAYVDLDAHHGDAVHDAFRSDPRVRLASIHEANRWPHTGRLDDVACGGALNLPVPTGFNDAELALAMQDLLLPFIARFRPQVVVVTCGADALDGDPLARMALGNTALWNAVESLVALAPSAVVLGGGGYNPWTLARYWTGLWARLSGRPIPQALPSQARAVLERLTCDLIDDEDVRPDWLATLADAPAQCAVRPEMLRLRDAALERISLAELA